VRTKNGKKETKRLREETAAESANEIALKRAHNQIRIVHNKRGSSEILFDFTFFLFFFFIQLVFNSNNFSLLFLLVCRGRRVRALSLGGAVILF
jgi:hypothetical protein